MKGANEFIPEATWRLADEFQTSEPPIPWAQALSTGNLPGITIIVSRNRLFATLNSICHRQS